MRGSYQQTEGTTLRQQPSDTRLPALQLTGCAIIASRCYSSPGSPIKTKRKKKKRKEKKKREEKGRKEAFCILNTLCSSMWAQGYF